MKKGGENRGNDPGKGTAALGRALSIEQSLWGPLYLLLGLEVIW